MRILEYRIKKQISVKAEITTLIPFPIDNDSDNYCLVIPSVISELPNNVMFIQDILIVEPHSKVNYYPKIVKLGITINQTITTLLPKGIELKILILDNIKDEVFKVDSIESLKLNSRSFNQSDNNKDLSYVSDGSVIKPKDKEQFSILQKIDNVLESKSNYKKEKEVESIQQDNIEISVKPQVAEEQQPVVKRGRGRPRKNSVVNNPVVEKQDSNNNTNSEGSSSILHSIFSSDGFEL